VSADVEAALALTREIAPHLAGKPPQVQGAALADLLATWLAGHLLPEDRHATDELRAALLERHLKAVRRLIPENAKAMGLPW
jgi:hypothetical protein